MRTRVRRPLLLIALGVALAVWFGLSATVGLPTWQVTGYKVVDNDSVRVDFEVYSPGGKDLVCTVQALAGDFAVVGSTDVPVGLAGADSTPRKNIKWRHSPCA